MIKKKKNIDEEDEVLKEIIVKMISVNRNEEDSWIIYYVQQLFFEIRHLDIIIAILESRWLKRTLKLKNKANPSIEQLSHL